MKEKKKKKQIIKMKKWMNKKYNQHIYKKIKILFYLNKIFTNLKLQQNEKTSTKLEKILTNDIICKS